MKRLILVWAATLLTACANVSPSPTATVAASPLPSAAYEPTSTSTPEATPTETATATPTETPKPGSETITFITTDGQEVVMPLFSGEKGTEDALKYAFGNSKPVYEGYRLKNSWNLINPRVPEHAKIIKSIPGFEPAGGPFGGPTNDGYYIYILITRINDGTLIIFQDRDENIKTIYLDGVDSLDLLNKLQNKTILIPAYEEPTPAPTPQP